MLKPNLSGNSTNKRWSSVLFPTPDGPDSTSGLRKSVRGDISATDPLCGRTRSACQFDVTFVPCCDIHINYLLPFSNDLQLMGAVCCRAQVCPDPLKPFPHIYLCLQPIDFDGEVTLFHFVLLRCVGKGAFGKVLVLFYFPVSHIHRSPQGSRRSAQTDARALCT